jgi:hypothetical protein
MIELMKMETSSRYLIGIFSPGKTVVFLYFFLYFVSVCLKCTDFLAYTIFSKVEGFRIGLSSTTFVRILE